LPAINALLPAQHPNEKGRRVMRPGFFLQVAHYLVYGLGNHLELLTDLLGGFSGGESSQYDRFFEIERRVRPDK
jgi:hypothetical protein